MVNAFVTMDGGNYTTEYALPLQFGLLWLIGTAPESGITMRRAFVLGILSGLQFWLKQNDIGIPIAILVLMALDFLRGQRGQMLRAVAAMAGGAVLVSALVILPFLVQGALAQFWEAAFLYNFEYVDITWFQRLGALRILPVTLPAMGLTTFAIVGWLIAALAIVNGLRWRGEVWTRGGDTLRELWGEWSEHSPRGLTHAQTVRLLMLVVIALPLECFFVILAGNTFDHYFLAVLPVMAVLAAFAFRILIAALERAAFARWLRAAFVTALLSVLLVFSIEPVRPIFYRITGRSEPALINFILNSIYGLL